MRPRPHAVYPGVATGMAHTLRFGISLSLDSCLFVLVFRRNRAALFFTRKALGGLVPLGFAVAGFTPAAYLRRRLRRPSAEILSWGGLRA